MYLHNKTSKAKYDEKQWKGLLGRARTECVSHVRCRVQKFWRGQRDDFVDEMKFLMSRSVVRFTKIITEENSSGIVKTDVSDTGPKSVKSPESDNSKSENISVARVKDNKNKIGKLNSKNIINFFCVEHTFPRKKSSIRGRNYKEKRTVIEGNIYRIGHRNLQRISIKECVYADDIVIMVDKEKYLQSNLQTCKWKDTPKNARNKN